MRRRKRVNVALLPAALLSAAFTVASAFATAGVASQPAGSVSSDTHTDRNASVAAPDTTASARSSSLLPSAYGVQIWRTDEGLPSDVVNAIVQDNDGYLWAGTNAGLARFDGVRFEVYDRAREPRLEGDDCTRLLVTRAGALWVGTVGGGLTRLEAGRFTGHGRAGGLLFQYPLSFLEDHEGRVWVGTNESLLRWNGRAFDRVGGMMQVVFEDAMRRIWLVPSGPHLVWERGSIHAPGSPSIVPAGVQWPYRIVPGAAGTTWFYEMKTGRLVRSRGDATTWFLVPPSVRDEGIRAFFESADGTLWLGTAHSGLFRLEDGEVRSLVASGELSVKTINAITQDREGNLWIGTTEGLCRLRRRSFAMIGREQGLTDERAWSVLEDRGGDLWIATETTVERIHGSRATTYTYRDGLAGPSGVSSLVEDRLGRVCIGTTVGLSCRDGDSFVNYFESDGLSHKNVRALYEDRKGRLWIGTGGGGVDVLEAGRFRAYRAKDGLGSDWVRFITEDHAGSIWLGTTGGLSRWREGVVTTWRKSDGLADDLVLDVHPDVDGSLWIGTFGGGLCRFRNGAFRTLTTADGLLDNTILRILESGGNLWMSTPRGIFRARRRDLHDRADGKIAHLTCVVYGKRDGLATTDCGGGTQPSGWKARDGRLFFPTSRGIAVVDPGGLASNRVAPPVLIEDLAHDGQPMSVGSAVLPAGTRRLEVRYTALSFAAPEKVRFRYRLEGFDPEWIDAGTRRVATYTALPPRDYVFRVLAANDDGVWNETGASLNLRVRPFLYQTWSFFFACIALAAAAAWGAYRLRLRQVESRFAAVLDERSRIARELHDTIARGFTGVSMQLEAVAARLPELPREARESLDRARLLIRSSLADARRSVRAMRPRALETGDLASSLRAMVEEATAGTAVRGDFSTRGARRPLPPLVEDHLLRVGQEALSNALKHSRCASVRVEMSYRRRSVELTVSDDGHGMVEGEAPDSSTSGMGLPGMRDRLAQIGGRLTVESASGRGTTVRAVAPLPGIAFWLRRPR